MSKEIKDYLHFYLGCECLVDGGVETDPIKLTGFSYDDTEGDWWCYFENTETGYALVQDVKPLLRPLSDMTGKEVLTAFHMSYSDADYKFDQYEEVNNNDYGWRARNQNGMECFVPKNSFKPEVFQYMLSIGIDLFGLIESGLAINKTKTPQP